MNSITYTVVSLKLLFAVAFVHEKSATKRLNCALGKEREENCPIDGGWTHWSVWATCKGECGQAGHQLRRRTCTNPTPERGGSTCHGVEIDTRACILPGCTMDQYEELVSEDPLRLGQFRMLEGCHQKFPALVDRCIVSNCYFETVENILHNESMKYWNSLMCVKHNVGCPVRGGWSSWTEWTKCSADCGLGAMFHSRNCTNPKPTSPELVCEGPSFEIRECTGTSCSQGVQGGEWTEWSKWSECSAKCGKGLRTRQRACKKNIVPNSENLFLHKVRGRFSQFEDRIMKSGSLCSGAKQEIEECEVKQCSVNGGWSNWETWSPCSSSCGLGAQTRSRSCSSPEPQGKGNACEGSFTEVQHCFQRPCSVKTHKVASFKGDGSLIFTLTARPSRVLLIYIRFLTLRSSGILVQRYQENCYGYSCDHLKIILEGSLLVVSALAKGCSVTAVALQQIEIGKWQDALINIAGSVVTVIINDSPDKIESFFNCLPIQPDYDQPMKVGERFQGQIQRLTINYKVIKLWHNFKQNSSAHLRGAAPYYSSNVVYELAEQDEAYQKISEKEFFQIQCPKDSNLWEIVLSLKIESIDGLIMLITDEDKGYILISLEDGYIKLMIHNSGLHTETSVPDKLGLGTWVHIQVDKMKPSENSTGNIGLSVNGGERIPLPLTGTNDPKQITVECVGQIFIGSISNDLKKKLLNLDSLLKENEILLNPISAVLAYLAVDGKISDLELTPVEITGMTEQFASRSISFADKYEEVLLPLGQKLQLNCVLKNKLNEGENKDALKMIWLKLNEVVKPAEKKTYLENEVYYSIKHQGSSSTLETSLYEARDLIEGFYSCWVQNKLKSSGHIKIAFGVSVIDSNIELMSLTIPMMVVSGICSTILLISLSIKIILDIYREHNEKFGDYQTFLRWIRGQQLSDKDIYESMVHMLHSKKAILILGSSEAIKLSEQRMWKEAQRTQSAEDFPVSSDRTSFHSNFTLPPLPKQTSTSLENITVESVMHKNYKQNDNHLLNETSQLSNHKFDKEPERKQNINENSVQNENNQLLQEHGNFKKSTSFSIQKRKKADNVRASISYLQNTNSHARLMEKSSSEMLEASMMSVCDCSRDNLSRITERDSFVTNAHDLREKRKTIELQKKYSTHDMPFSAISEHLLNLDLIARDMVDKDKRKDYTNTS